MTTARITTDRPDFTFILGALDDEQRDHVLSLLDQADERLDGVRETLATQTGNAWTFDGVVLESSISGQISIDALLEDAAGKLSFFLQLRPRNYFPTEENMWQPGRPPLRMATDGWDVEGEINVRFKTRVAGRPYTIQEQVVALEAARYENAIDAVEAFAARAEEIAGLALSREATVEAWRPEEPAS